jgi:hypothetical protein
MNGTSAAERLLKQFGILSVEDIDLDAIAWRLGAAVKYRHMDAADGTIVGSPKRAVISINKSIIPTRQRFTLAHEIGHWHHHRGRVLFCNATDIGGFSGGPLDPECQADAFASDLVLPRYLVQPKILEIKRPTLAFAREIADEFRASMTATLIKILNENRFPILLICHRKDRRRWFKRADLVPQWWFPREDLDAQTFAFEILHNRRAEDASPRKNGAGAWFEFKNVDRYEIFEQSFALPNDEVLTMLTIPPEGLG